MRKEFGACLRASLLASAVGLATLLGGTSAHAFCGFYVAGGDASLFNDATQVVLMRHGTRTILSMQNNYSGPREDFAMVVPVPVVLQQEQVKTLEASLFSKIDQLSAPRLVEYWEQDPCATHGYDDIALDGATTSVSESEPNADPVVVEAEFRVGEYDIVILSTTEATALESWLTQNEYNIPDGADALFQPYVSEGMYFFVAKVAIDEVEERADGAVLSPLRFHYDSDSFSLPIRLGLINSRGDQDLIVYTLGQNQRYEVANRANITIPTNLNVVDGVRENFGAFYRLLFDQTVAENPGAAITEYAWDASTCDPCPGPTLDEADFLTLGMDTLGGNVTARNWTLTRLHLRYSADVLGDDLVFVEANPIVGGREVRGADGQLEQGSADSSFNNFQGRYAIRHRWDGPIDCDEPHFDYWGGPDGAESVAPTAGALSSNTESMADAAVAEVGTLPSDKVEDLLDDGSRPVSDSGCTCSSQSVGVVFPFLLLSWMYARRRRMLRRGI